MCLVRECWTGLHEMAMAAFESQYIVLLFGRIKLTNLSPLEIVMPPDDVLLTENREARASAAYTTEDIDTTRVVPLSNASNIGLNSKSNSFDVVIISVCLMNIFMTLLDAGLTCHRFHYRSRTLWNGVRNDVI
ncbi:hypothetical protein Tco_0613364 [Tanacetum coccineum]|uniref:Uncharacterized protein n=1 Tax=Tanacetum coccineum TaxID=301880 RepID=A0ABQ4Y0Z2_9ASTR